MKNSRVVKRSKITFFNRSASFFQSADLIFRQIPNVTFNISQNIDQTSLEALADLSNENQ